MKTQTIKYIGFYDTVVNQTENRNYALSAANKMDYISNVLIQLGYHVLIVSPSETRNPKFYRGKKIKINEKVTLDLFPTFPAGNKLNTLFSMVTMDVLLFLYLMRNTKKGEPVIVYHSLALKSIVRLAKRFKRFVIILEVEEIYQDVSPLPKWLTREEFRTITDANGYIFPTQLLNQKLNSSEKPNAIVHGTYKIEPDRGERFTDGKIHIVYAGTFDAVKGGAITSILAAEFLTEKYHLHVIGFGTVEEKNMVMRTIEEVSNRSKSTITFDGLLAGEDYIIFLQKCDIGLSTQTPGLAYNDTSFPSKILSYLSNGLRVVSIRIKAIETSGIGKDLYYFDEQNPKEIADVIMSINVNEHYDSRQLLNSLNQQFINDMKRLLGDLS